MKETEDWPTTYRFGQSFCFELQQRKNTSERQPAVAGFDLIEPIYLGKYDNDNNLTVKEY